MKVLLIHNEYGAPSGEERTVNRIAALLRKNGHEVDCLLEESLPPGAGFRSKANAMINGVYSLKGVRTVRRRVKSFRPDIVQVQNLYPSLSPWILPIIQQAGVPIVMRCANYRLICPNGLLLSHGRVCERCMGGREYWCLLQNCEDSLPKSFGYALRNVTARIFQLYLDNITFYYAQTEFQRQKLIEGGFPGERIAVIPNMVETSALFAKPPRGAYVAYVGRVSPEKGVATLLQAAQVLPHIPFRLAGDFRRIPAIDREKPPNVELCGYLQGQALVDFYRRCRFLVLPSTWYEGFPGVIIEAMLHGKSVVCSNIGGLPEIVADGENGLLFQPGDYMDLAAKIEWLWNRPDRCGALGQAGRDKVLREYSPDKYYERLMNLYHQALELHETSKSCS